MEEVIPRRKTAACPTKCKTCETQFQVLSAARKNLWFFSTKKIFCLQQGSVKSHCRSWTHWQRKISANLFRMSWLIHQDHDYLKTYKWWMKVGKTMSGTQSTRWHAERQGWTWGWNSHAEQDQLECLQQNQKDWRENAKDMKIYQLKKKGAWLQPGEPGHHRPTPTWSQHLVTNNWSKVGERYGLTTPNQGRHKGVSPRE